MEQNVSRRGFIGAAIGTGAAAAMTPTVALAQGGGGGGGSNRVPRNRRGIQLYTLRRLTPNQAGARNVLRALGRMGYTEVEKFQTYGWTVEEFSRELDRAGLRCISGHDGPGFPGAVDWDAYRDSLEYAAELGQEFTGLAWWPGPYNQEAMWHQLADHLEAAGEIARKEFGLQFFYHNHDFEFTNRFSGRPGLRHPAERDDPPERQVPARPVLDHRGRRQRRPVPERRPGPLRLVPRQGPRLGRPQGGRRLGPAGLGGRRSRHAGLPGPVRRRRRPQRPARQALLHRARRPAALAPGRPGGGAHDREGRDQVPRRACAGKEELV